MALFKYAPSCYDENFHLRVSPLLWLILLWSTHHVLALGVALFANSGEIFKSAMDYAYNVPSLASNLPGALVLFARINRSPLAGDRVRWIWRNGTTLLASGLGLQIGVLAFMQAKKLAEFDEAMIASLAASAVLLVALLASSYVKDVFADFPSKDEAKKG
jgi:hypothetical protein